MSNARNLADLLVPGENTLQTVAIETDRIILNGTDGSATDAGDFLLLDATASSTNVGEQFLFEPATDDGSAIMSTFFAGGGTLMLDHCFSQTTAIEKDWFRWSQSLFPKSSWETISRSHVLSYTFYLLEKKMLLGNDGVPIRLLDQDGRFIMLWNRSKRFSWETMMRNQVRINSNPTDIETGLRFYVNLLMYLLTGDYKTDQLHLPTILLRRK